MKQTDLLVAEIGSTTTVVSAFDQLDSDPVLVGQGQFPTTVAEGDGNIGLAGAIRDLANNLGEEINWKRLMASSSAAGGLRMTVHGLVYDMTVRAAREAALGAGANLKWAIATHRFNKNQRHPTQYHLNCRWRRLWRARYGNL